MSANGIITSVDEAMKLYHDVLQERIKEVSPNAAKVKPLDVSAYLETKRPEVEALFAEAPHGIHAPGLTSLLKADLTDERMQGITNFIKGQNTAARTIARETAIQSLASHGLTQVVPQFTGTAEGSRVISGAENIKTLFESKLDPNGKFLFEKAGSNVDFTKIFKEGEAVTVAHIGDAAKGLNEKAGEIVKTISTGKKPNITSMEAFVEGPLKAIPKLAITAPAVVPVAVTAPVAGETATTSPATTGETTTPAQPANAAATTGTEGTKVAEVEKPIKATQARFDEIIKEEFKEKSVPNEAEHVAGLKKAFAKTFEGKENEGVTFTAEAEGKIRAATGKFIEEAKKTGEEAKGFKEGTAHKTFLEAVSHSDVVTGHDAAKVTENVKTAVADAKSSLNLSWYKNPNHAVGKFISGENYGSPIEIIKKEWTKQEGKESAEKGKIAMRVGGTLTGVGLIISGFNDFKGREANDNSGQVESHPLSGLMKTVAGAGLTGISLAYKKGIGAANKNVAIGAA